MFIDIKIIKNKIATVLLVMLIIISVYLISNIVNLKSNLDQKTNLAIGAKIHTQEVKDYNVEHLNEIDDKDNGENESTYDLEERFQRPSKLPAKKLKYDFKPKDEKEVPPYTADGFPAVYQSPEDVIQAYFAILKNAANMTGYEGGCGTILWMDLPYPYAYDLLSESTKKEISLEDFKDSFKGTGRINLLQLEPAFQLGNTPENIKYYFVEIETLKGHKEKKHGTQFDNQPNYFEYYYGIVTTEYSTKDGWKIKSVDYLPERYLCHPLHGWDYFYDWFIDIIYNDWYGLNIKIDNTEIENNYLKVFASNENNQYRFDFIRLTNGDDVLLHEYIKENELWKEVSILKPEDEAHYKVTINKFGNAV